MNNLYFLLFYVTNNKIVSHFFKIIASLSGPVPIHLIGIPDNSSTLFTYS